mmetsp:Transcript_17962/g.24112  ORF Transcript_17962/g.24112 Transcript_17962/m.24112 type:complete len:98 (+) Transcript_17962:290-583(+)
MLTKDQTVAGGVDFEFDVKEEMEEAGKHPENYFRVMFYWRTMTDGRGTIDYHWLNSTRCRDYEPYSEQGLDQDEFRSDYWICPRTDSFTIKNSPATY